jgi:mannose-6-phosphate isomerase
LRCGPVILASNQPADRFYRGGENIRDFRSEAAAGDRVPEDWVASTTTLFGESEVGLTWLPDGSRLIDEIGENSVSWLGAEHVANFGADTKLLVKLLDAGERLPIHLHPDGAFAHEYLGSHHGKAEAWYILNGGTVHLGFQREVSPTELAGWVEAQDVDVMMAAMHAIEVQSGDSVYVPPGLPHSIGAGIFLVEVQEPEDLSILLEWKDFSIDGPRDGHLGIGFHDALLATDTRGWKRDQIDELIVRGGIGANTLAAAAEPYFRAELHEITDASVLDPGYSTLVVLNGHGTLATAIGSAAELHAGDTMLIPHGVGQLTIDGTLTLLRCRPPLHAL